MALGNPSGGVQIDYDSSSNTIGGVTADAGNLITNNGGPGVVVGDNAGDLCIGNPITGNRIFGNTGQAIDLGDDGVTDNGTSPRQGPNNLQNFPIFVLTADGQTEGWLGGSTPDTTFRIDFFASAGYGPGGSGEAQDDLGSLEVTTDASGQVSFAVPFTAPAGLPIITATATDPQGNTSELTALRPGTLQAPSLSVRAVANQSLAFATQSGDGIAIEDPEAGPAQPGLGPDAFGLRRDADLVEYRRPDRLGRWDRIAVVQRSAGGARRGAPGPDLPPAGGSARLRPPSLSVPSPSAQPAPDGAIPDHGRRLRGRHDGRQRPRLAPPGDPGRQSCDWPDGYDRFRHPRRRGPDHRTPHPPACDHGLRADRRYESAGFCRGAADRGERPRRRAAPPALTIAGSDVTVRGLAVDQFAFVS